MSKEMLILALTAASVAFFHTLFGPDHYIPFVAMARARKWSSFKTIWITTLCGIGHIGSSVLLGTVGIAFGITVTRLKAVESFRGNIAAWILIGFGLLYFIWGLRKAIRNRPHKHLHIHRDENSHVHTHGHSNEHVHVHTKEGTANLTPWILFTIFVFGPCEPLIPILMYPAARGSLMDLVFVTAVFGLVTIATMLSVVLISSLGINLLPMERLERYTHALAGVTICLCGMAILFLGL